MNRQKENILTALSMQINTPLSSVMSSDFLTISPEKSIEAATKIFQKKNVQYLAVVDHNEFIGVLSMKEISKFRHNYIFQNLSDEEIKLRFRKHSVRKIMRTNLVVVCPETSLLQLCEIYKSILFDAAFVVDAGSMVGFFNSKIFEQVGEESCSRAVLSSY